MILAVLCCEVVNAEYEKEKSLNDSRAVSSQDSPQLSSVISSSSFAVNIIINNPIDTIINSTNPNQPSTIAEVPIPLCTLPLPKSAAIVLAATDAVCCHNTETRTKIAATKISASADWETGREGNGLISRTLSSSLSYSSCQPGKVARRMKQTKEKIMATILKGGCMLVEGIFTWDEGGDLH